MHPGELVMDEFYYVNDARDILDGQGKIRFEHPPMGEFYIVSGVFLFGDNPLGWRFFSVIFGTIGIVLFYLICRKLDMPRDASLFATFLLSLENLSFLKAGVAMLDVYTFTFMLVAFLLYLNGRYLLSWVSVGLSALAKLSGWLVLPVIFLHWLFSSRTRPRWFLGLILSVPASFVLLISLFDLIIWKQMYNPIERIGLLLTQSSAVTFADFTHPASSRPWDWILRPEIMWYWYDPHYIGAISFTVWALIIPAVIYMVFRAKGGNNAAIFGLSWFAGTYLVWIPMSLITDRLSYVYYFYPTVGAICIGIGLGLSQLLHMGNNTGSIKLKRAMMSIVPGYLLLHVAVFVMLSPVFSQWINVIPTPSP
jgi:predicted membrane-bound dolichyl-phosphate-mannose-protein mannosyltransferase